MPYWFWLTLLIDIERIAWFWIFCFIFDLPIPEDLEIMFGLLSQGYVGPVLYFGTDHPDFLPFEFDGI